MVLDFGNSLFAQRDVRETATSLLSVSDVLAPVGAVMPWLKNLTGTPGLPVGWVECNGQTISDAASVYNGTTLPDLNGDNRFLRGNSTSGTTGGSTTQTASGTTDSHTLTITEMPAHTHTVDRRTAGTPGSTDFSLTSQTANLNETNTSSSTGGGGGHNHGFTSGSFNNEPQYYNIVFIMRIK